MELPSRLQVTRTEFLEHRIRQYYQGGGVVVFAQDKLGDFRILLGREQHTATWRGGGWSGFEGGKKAEDRTVVGTAIRECHEECLCLLPNISSTLERGDYWIRIVVRLEDSRSLLERYHATFLVEVEFDETLPLRFNALRSSVTALHARGRELSATKPRALFEGACAVGRVAVTSGGFAVVAHVCDAATGCLRTVQLTGASADEALSWARRRECLSEDAMRLDHAAIKIVRWEGFLQTLSATPDFLEKDELRWFSLPELSHALSNRGALRRGRGKGLRPFFVPVIQTALEEFASHPPSPDRVRVRPPPPPLRPA